MMLCVCPSYRGEELELASRVSREVAADKPPSQMSEAEC